MSVFGFLGQPGVPGPAQPQQALQAQQPLGADSGQQSAQNQYIADALAKLQQSGVQSLTPGALGSNLMADGLLQYTKRQQAAPGAWQGPGSGLLNLGNAMGIGDGTSAGDF